MTPSINVGIWLKLLSLTTEYWLYTFYYVVFKQVERITAKDYCSIKQC